MPLGSMRICGKSYSDFFGHSNCIWRQQYRCEIGKERSGQKNKDTDGVHDLAHASSIQAGLSKFGI